MKLERKWSQKICSTQFNLNSGWHISAKTSRLEELNVKTLLLCSFNDLPLVVFICEFAMWLCSLKKASETMIPNYYGNFIFQCIISTCRFSLIKTTKTPKTNPHQKKNNDYVSSHLWFKHYPSRLRNSSGGKVSIETTWMDVARVATPIARPAPWMMSGTCLEDGLPGIVSS